MSLLSERVGLEFELASISIRVGSFELRNASLYEPGVGPLLDLEYGAVESRVLSVPRGRVDVHHLHLDRPRLNIDRKHDPQRGDGEVRVLHTCVIVAGRWS